MGPRTCAGACGTPVLRPGAVGRVRARGGLRSRVWVRFRAAEGAEKRERWSYRPRACQSGIRRTFGHDEVLGVSAKHENIVNRVRVLEYRRVTRFAMSLLRDREWRGQKASAEAAEGRTVDTAAVFFCAVTRGRVHAHRPFRSLDTSATLQQILHRQQ